MTSDHRANSSRVLRGQGHGRGSSGWFWNLTFGGEYTGDSEEWYSCTNTCKLCLIFFCLSEKFVSYEDLFYLMIKPHDLEVSILALVGTQVGACIAAALGIIIMGSEDKYDSIS